MPTFGVTEYFTHPAGTHTGTLVDWEEVDGQYGPQIRWEFETGQTRDDGVAARVRFFTGCNFGGKTKLTQLLNAFGYSAPTTASEAAQFDPNALLGAQCRLVIIHKAGEQEGQLWANIDKVLPVLKAPAPAPRVAQQRAQPAAAAGAKRNPFAGNPLAQEPEPVNPDTDDPFVQDEAAA